jgi:hypothetical protein
MKKLAIVITMLFAYAALNAQNEQSPSAEKANTKKSENEMESSRRPLKKLEGTEVTMSTKNNFAADFPNVTNARWARSENFDEATFTQNGKEMTAYYDYDGEFVGTTNPINFSDLPDRAQKIIQDKYKDYKVEQVIFFDDNDKSDVDMVLWSTQFDDEDLYFALLAKGNKRIIVKTNPSGNVSLFKEL